MEIKVKSYSSQSSLISSIIYFIIGAILFRNHDEVITVLSYGIGIILGIVAVVNIVTFWVSAKNPTIRTKKMSLVFGAIALGLAIIFIFFHDLVGKLLRFIVGAWILFSGIIRLINVLSISPKSKKFIPLLIVSIILIGIGIFTIVYSGAIVATIGIIMMIYAAVEIAGYIFYSKGSSEPEEAGTTTLIVQDEITEEKDSSNKNVKDVKNVKEKKKKKKKKDEEE